MASARPVGQKVARSTGALVAARLLSAATGIVLVGALFKGLGEHDFGVWVLLTSVIGLLALLDLGLASGAVREVAAAEAGAEPTQVPAILGLALGWALILTPIVMVGVFALWGTLSQAFGWQGDLADLRGAAGLLLLAYLMAALEVPWRSVLEGCQDYLVVGVVSAVAAVLVLAATLFALHQGGGLLAVTGIAALVAAARTAALLVAARLRWPSYGPRLGAITREHLNFFRSYGLRVQVSGASSGVHVELDRLVLGGVAGAAVAGSFEIGARLLNLLKLPPALALTALFPAAVSISTQRGKQGLDRLYLVTTRYLALLLAPAAAALMVCADPLVRLWLGRPVEWAAPNLVVLTLAYTVNLVAGPATIVARAEGRPGLETRYVTLSVLLNLALTVPLIWWLGPIGVPVSTTLAVIASSVYFLWHFHRVGQRPLGPLWGALWPPAAAATIAGLLVWRLSGLLPDGDSRWEAGLAIMSRGGLVLLVALAVLVLVGKVGVQDYHRLRGLSAAGQTSVDVRESPLAVDR